MYKYLSRFFMCYSQVLILCIINYILSNIESCRQVFKNKDYIILISLVDPKMEILSRARKLETKICLCIKKHKTLFFCLSIKKQKQIKCSHIPQKIIKPTLEVLNFKCHWNYKTREGDEDQNFNLGSRGLLIKISPDRRT